MFIFIIWKSSDELALCKFHSFREKFMYQVVLDRVMFTLLKFYGIEIEILVLLTL